MRCPAVRTSVRSSSPVSRSRNTSIRRSCRAPSPAGTNARRSPPRACSEFGSWNGGQAAQPQDGPAQVEPSGVALGCLVVAGGQPPPFLELVDGALHSVAVLVQLGVVA